MTKTQANEPGFVLVPIDATDKMVEAMGNNLMAGLRTVSGADLGELYRTALAAAPIVPAPAYGVKGRPASVQAAFDIFHERLETGPHATAIFQYVLDLEYRCLSSAPVEEADAKTVAWRNIASAPKDGTVVDLWHEEFGRHADCYWGKPQHCCGEAGQYCDSDWHLEPEGWVHGAFNDLLYDAESFTHWMPCPAGPASTIPSEPEAKGEAGAGPVGEAVAWRWRLRPEHNGAGPSDWVYTSEYPTSSRSDMIEVEPLCVHHVEEPGEVERLRAALQQAEGELSLIDCEGITETRNLADVLDRIKAFASRGAANARAALSTQESSAALAGDGKERGR